MIQKRPFGWTGHASSVTLFGAAALKNVTQSVADHVLDLLFEYGVNHIDTAPGYGDSELRIGPWMERYRAEFFLATKTRERTYAGAREQLYRSLDRLRVDRVDLLQMHALRHPDDWDMAMGADGALEALVEAKEAGLVAHIGVTGHGWTIPAMHKRSLARYDFDSVLMPWNYIMASNELYARTFEEVVSLCKQRGAAVQTIKSIARGPWATTEQNRNTWYQPLEAQSDIDRAVHWVLGRGDVFVNTVGDVDLLSKVLDAAARFERITEEQAMEDMVCEQRMTSLFGLGS